MTVVISGDTGISPVTAAGTSALVDGLTVGRGAGSVSTNTAVGAGALAANTSGAQNVAIGCQSAYSNTTGTLTVTGYLAGYSNTTGTNNAAFGDRALAFNTTGGSNVAIGTQALNSNTTANNNTAVGYQAGYSNTTGADNLFIGYQAGYSNTTGTLNTYLGRWAGKNGTGDNNTIVGINSGYQSTGSRNTFVGARASGSSCAEAMTTGSANTILGAYSGNQGGLDIRTASNVIVLSDGDGNPRFGFGYSPTGSGTYSANGNYFTIGNGTTTSSTDGVVLLNGSNAAGRGPAFNGYANGSATWYMGAYAWVVGGTSQYFAVSNSGGGGVYLNGTSATSWTAVSDETRKIIIEPITDAANKVATLRTVIGRLKTDTDDVRRPYLIAQDVQAVLPEAVSESEDKEGPVLGLSYTEVIPLLVAAIKELKAEIDTLKGQA